MAAPSTFKGIQKAFQDAPGPEAWVKVRDPRGREFLVRPNRKENRLLEEEIETLGIPPTLQFQVHPEEVERVGAMYYQIQELENGATDWQVGTVMEYPSEELFTDETWEPAPQLEEE
jgi:hypothetical protein